jgi:hypothetical protein
MEMTKLTVYVPGRDADEIHAEDWVSINQSQPDVPHGGGVETWSDWQFSASAQAFRQTGGNSNGATWDRYSEAVKESHPADALPWPCHVE